jgi:hypothetical protein
MKLESRPGWTRTYNSDPSPRNEICFSYLIRLYRSMSSRDSAVGIAAGYRLDGLWGGLRVRVGKRFFSFPLPPNRGSKVQWLGREADHSPPTSAEVKNTWIYTSSAPYVFKANRLIS